MKLGKALATGFAEEADETAEDSALIPDTYETYETFETFETFEVPREVAAEASAR